MTPSATAAAAKTNGRGHLGRFATGNKFGTGNPHRSAVQKLRAAMLSAITEDAVAAVVLSLVNLAIDGNVPAAKVILDVVGKPEADTPATGLAITDTNFQEVKNALLARAN